jgi:hypothetical protein
MKAQSEVRSDDVCERENQYENAFELYGVEPVLERKAGKPIRHVWIRVSPFIGDTSNSVGSRQRDKDVMMCMYCELFRCGGSCNLAPGDADSHDATQGTKVLASVQKHLPHEAKIMGDWKSHHDIGNCRERETF